MTVARIAASLGREEAMRRSSRTIDRKGRPRAARAALRLVPLVWVTGVFGCHAAVGGGPAPAGGVSGVVSEREPAESREGRREQRLRDALMQVYRAQQRFHAETGRYTDDPYALRGDGAGPLQPAPGIRVTIPEATADGFSAVARQAPFECALRVGTAAPPRDYAGAPGVVACR